MSTLEILIELLKPCIAKRNLSAITPDASLFDDIAIDGDSFDAFIEAIEGHYEIELDDDDIDTFETLGDIADFLESQA